MIYKLQSLLKKEANYMNLQKEGHWERRHEVAIHLYIKVRKK
jgi:hypothetical protein